MDAPPPTMVPDHLTALLTAATMTYVVGLKSSAARVQHTQVLALVRRMLAEYGRAQIYEWYQALTIGKVIFDIDGKASATTAPALLLAALDGVRAFFAPDPPPRTVLAASHGGDKLSFRVYCVGVRMRMSDIKARILRLHLDGRSSGPFDPAIYSANQKLRAVGSLKTPEDARVLKLIDADHHELQPTAELLVDTLVQVVDDSWPLLVEPPEGTTAKPTKITKSSIKRAAPEPEPKSEAAAPSCTVVVAETRQPAKRGRPAKEDTLPATWRELLVNMGFRDVRSLKAFTSPDHAESGYSFTASDATRKDCPCCARTHDSNNWFMVSPEPGLFAVKSQSVNCKYLRHDSRTTVVEAIQADPTSIQDKLDAMQLAPPLRIDTKNPNLHYHRIACTRPECWACDERHGQQAYDLREMVKGTWLLRADFDGCTGRLLHTDGMLVQYLKRVLEDPSSTALTSLYLMAHRDTLWCDQSLTDIRSWNCQTRRWITLSPKTFASHVGAWLTSLLTAVKRTGEFSEYGKTLREALALCKSFGQQMAVATNILSTQCQQWVGKLFDADPHLLGCEDCVIDLRTGEARPASQHDLVSRSVGFNFLEHTYDEETLTPVRNLMRDIYPVDEEREFMQRFAGYCLLGDYEEKLFMCLTDRRQGYNGKSTLRRLLLDAMGEYALLSDNAFLYARKQTRDINAHDSGLLQYKGVRLVLFEELSDNQAIDYALVKNLTGGGMDLKVRAAYDIKPEKMRWTGKLVLIFNEGSCPQLKVEDAALVKRMTVVQHRSLFCRDAAELTAHSAEEHTFMADTDRAKAVTPPMMLAWMLEGLQRYWPNRFQQIPKVLEGWKRELVMEHDDVAAWAADCISEEPAAHLTPADALQSFRTVKPNSTLGKNKISSRLKDLFPGKFAEKRSVAGAIVPAGFRGLKVDVDV